MSFKTDLLSLYIPMDFLSYLTMFQLTVKKIIEIQTKIIDTSIIIGDEGTGGLVRDFGTLEYIVNNQDYYHSPIENSAWILLSISSMHPFYQGNKRTALESSQMLLFFNNNGSIISGNPEETNEYIRKIAIGIFEIEEIINWINTHLS
ncbi:MAG: type II toxin-antitoxin system death-on-curing family toxin [Methanobacteriota archaeon]